MAYEGGPMGLYFEEFVLGQKMITRGRTITESDLVQFAGLTGDYNGIHLSSWYARLFGFEGAFLHPQLSLGLCMAHLAGREDWEGQRLDAWLKGPVYYGSAVTLRAAISESDSVFALLADGDERPCIVGHWRLAQAK